MSTAPKANTKRIGIETQLGTCIGAVDRLASGHRQAVRNSVVRTDVFEYRTPLGFLLHPATCRHDVQIQIAKRVAFDLEKIMADVVRTAHLEVAGSFRNRL